MQLIDLINSKIIKSEFIKNSLILTIGTVISQIFPIIISPVLTRLYSPENYGLLALFTGFSSMIAVISTLRYEMAIVLPKDDNESINIAGLSGLIVIVISILSLVIVFVFNSQICFMLRNQHISGWLYLAPASIFLTGIYQILNYWTIKTKQFKNLSLSKISQTMTGSSTNLILGFCNTGTAGLIIGGVFGQFVSTIVLFFQSLKRLKEKFVFITRKEMMRQAVIHKDFPRINSLQAFFDIFRDSLVIFIISSLFNAHMLGLYSFTLRILKAPSSMIGSSIAQVFFQKASETKNNGESLQMLVKKLVTRLCLISFPVFLILFLFSPFIFSFVFGSKWRDAGIMTQILCPWFFLNFIVSPVSQIPIIVGKQKHFFYFSFIYNTLSVIIIFVSGLFIKKIFYCLIIFSFSLSIVLIILIIWIVKISVYKNHIKYDTVI
jgi:O-antigen/teichoic acid export membrane protein